MAPEFVWKAPKYTPDQAIARAVGLCGAKYAAYRLGPTELRPDGSPKYLDCAGLICWAYGLPRHQPGFNVGSWATVSDDINVDSMYEDANHRQQIFCAVTEKPRPGDIILSPTTRRPYLMGHVGLVGYGNMVYHAHGPNGRYPAVGATPIKHFLVGRPTHVVGVWYAYDAQ